MLWERKEHWEKIYSAKKVGEVSWFQAETTKFLELIRLAAPPKKRKGALSSTPAPAPWGGQYLYAQI